MEKSDAKRKRAAPPVSYEATLESALDPTAQETVRKAREAAAQIHITTAGPAPSEVRDARKAALEKLNAQRASLPDYDRDWKRDAEVDANEGPVDDDAGELDAAEEVEAPPTPRPKPGGPSWINYLLFLLVAAIVAVLLSRGGGG